MYTKSIRFLYENNTNFTKALWLKWFESLKILEKKIILKQILPRQIFKNGCSKKQKLSFEQDSLFKIHEHYLKSSLVMYFFCSKAKDFAYIIVLLAGSMKVSGLIFYPSLPCIKIWMTFTNIERYKILNNIFLSESFTCIRILLNYIFEIFVFHVKFIKRIE